MTTDLLEQGRHISAMQYVQQEAHNEHKTLQSVGMTVLITTQTRCRNGNVQERQVTQ